MGLGLSTTDVIWKFESKMDKQIVGFSFLMEFIDSTKNNDSFNYQAKQIECMQTDNYALSISYQIYCAWQDHSAHALVNIPLNYFIYLNGTSVCHSYMDDES